jgi:hypothetical protein
MIHWGLSRDSRVAKGDHRSGWRAHVRRLGPGPGTVHPPPVCLSSVTATGAPLANADGALEVGTWLSGDAGEHGTG